jgi:hypothetical protein
MLRRALPLLLVACTTNAKKEPDGPAPVPAATAEAPAEAEPKPEPATGAWRALLPEDAKTRDVARLRHIERLPALTDAHREHLREHGFFVTAQAVPESKPGDAAKARSGRRARHLFQVYERNDYIRFPSYVTVDLSIDLTHQYFDVVLRRVERDHLVPKLRQALQGFVAEALRLHKTAKTPQAKQAALDAAVYWGTALHLLEQPAKGDAPEVAVARAPWYDDAEARAEMGAHEGDVPEQPRPSVTRLDRLIAKDVAAVVEKFQAAARVETFDRWGQRFDLTLAKPRGHYAGSGLLQRYFRAMTMLGLSRFVVTGKDARPEALAAIASSIEGSPEARKAYEGVLDVTNFVVGEPPTKGLIEASAAMAEHVDGGGLDAAVEPATMAKITEAWKTFPEHPVAREGPVVMPVGQRVFVDTQGMSELLGIMRELPPTRQDFVARAMGAAGSAAVLGSDTARDVVLAAAGDDRPRTETAIERGRTFVDGAAPRTDAYHGTLRALAAAFGTDPLWFSREAHQLRMLQTYAGAWAMLRHDTLLYAYQMGAECDAEELTSPYGWVEPYPEVYRALAEVVSGFEKRLKDAGIPTAGKDDDPWETGQYSIGSKTEAVIGFLEQMIAWSNKELAGQPFTEKDRTDIAMVGGRAEHVVLTLADAFELGEGNDDMAVIADVFTFWGQALEVAVGHPELVYAVIPTPEGWAVARGAVLAYREFFVPAADRMTDEEWRERLGDSEDLERGTRPKWLRDISAPPVGVIELPSDGKGQERCEYFGGLYEL